jgi:hypothetical protein
MVRDEKREARGRRGTAECTVIRAKNGGTKPRCMLNSNNNTQNTLGTKPPHGPHDEMEIPWARGQ